MLWRTSPAATELEEVALGWLRQLIGLPDTFEGVIYDTASISTLHALAAAREAAVAGVRRARARRAIRLPRRPRLLLRARALVGRQGGHPARPRPRRRSRAIPADAEFRMRPDALADARSAQDRAAGWRPDRGRRDGRQHVEHERRSGRRRSRTICAARARVAARGRGVCRRRRDGAGLRVDPRAAPSAPTRSSSIRTSGCSRRST